MHYLSHFKTSFWFRAVVGGWALLAWGGLAGCTDDYLPDALASPPSFLVVDGFLNAQGVTTIKLSRTYAVGSKATTPPVEGRATAYVEEEGGPRFALREAPAGTYSSAALTLSPTKKYRLRLTTIAGKDYASDFVPAKVTPPIDAVTWRLRPDAFNLYVSAHDATNGTQYYRWDYDETWEIRPAYDTGREYVNHRVRFRVVPFPRVCWGTAPAKTVQIDKTTALSQDVVNKHVLRTLPANTERLFTRYSILVRQYALTKEEYAYWELLRKNTESVGSLFDPQPAQLTGNVRCLNGPDPVLGFVGAHSVTEKRIFIARTDLPTNSDILSGYEKCIPPEFVNLYPGTGETPESILERTLATFVYLPIDFGINGLTGEDGIFVAKPDCLDCRLRGTDVKPPFWP